MTTKGCKMIKQWKQSPLEKRELVVSLNLPTNNRNNIGLSGVNRAFNTGLSF
jgi:hypothetical protein